MTNRIMLSLQLVALMYSSFYSAYEISDKFGALQSIDGLLDSLQYICD